MCLNKTVCLLHVVDDIVCIFSACETELKCVIKSKTCYQKAVKKSEQFRGFFGYVCQREENT